MPRKRDRASAQGLLPLMEARPWKDGSKITYRYHPRGGKPINLGTDKQAAIRKVLDLNGASPDHGTLRWVWEQFQSAPRYKRLAARTQDDYTTAWRQLDKVLGHLRMYAIETTTIARYVHIERASAPRRANLEKTLLSLLFGHAIKLGICEHNATVGVEPHQLERSDKVADPAVLARFLHWLQGETPQRRIIAMMAEFTSLGGSRRVEFLDIEWDDFTSAPGFVRVPRAKQRGGRKGKVFDHIKITPPLQHLIERLQALRAERKVNCAWVFPTRDNNAYTEDGFRAMWQKIMQKAMAEGILTPEERFTFHNLRSYYATMHKQAYKTLPDMHANPQVTATVYDRNKTIERDALGG